jgi:hypothetical protein
MYAQAVRVMALTVIAKLLTYFDFLFSGFGHKQSKHIAFHKDKETWKVINFNENYDDIHYESTHKVTCRDCSYESIRYRVWPKSIAWPFGMGSTVEEAKAKAEKVSADNE